MERYTTNEGIVTDAKTGLQWEEKHHGPMSWYDADEYAINLRLGGFDDWRLPTRLELESLLDLDRHNPASDFPGMPPLWFWSSSSFANVSSYAWLVSFYDCNVLARYRTLDGFVRCVRGGRADYGALDGGAASG